LQLTEPPPWSLQFGVSTGDVRYSDQAFGKFGDARRCGKDYCLRHASSRWPVSSPVAATVRLEWWGLGCPAGRRPIDSMPFECERCRVNFSEQPPSTEWAALKYRGEKIAEVWFKPEGEPFVLAFRIPQKSFQIPEMGQLLTTENLLKAV